MQLYAEDTAVMRTVVMVSNKHINYIYQDSKLLSCVVYFADPV